MAHVIEDYLEAFIKEFEQSSNIIHTPPDGPQFYNRVESALREYRGLKWKRDGNMYEIVSIPLTGFSVAISYYTEEYGNTEKCEMHHYFIVWTDALNKSFNTLDAALNMLFWVLSKHTRLKIICTADHAIYDKELQIHISDRWETVVRRKYPLSTWRILWNFWKHKNKTYYQNDLIQVKSPSRFNYKK